MACMYDGGSGSGGGGGGGGGYAAAFGTHAESAMRLPIARISPCTPPVKLSLQAGEKTGRRARGARLMAHCKAAPLAYPR